MKCEECGTVMNPVQSMLSEKHGVCGDCTKKARKKTIGKSKNNTKKRR